jgi:hypothetical protein
MSVINQQSPYSLLGCGSVLGWRVRVTVHSRVSLKIVGTAGWYLLSQVRLDSDSSPVVWYSLSTLASGRLS